MKKTLAACQSNYIPWKGYFDMIGLADEFVLYDNVQYTKNDWRNKNFIKTNQGLQALTIPVQSKSKFGQKIHETIVDKNYWRKKHWKAINHNYEKSAHFNDYKEQFEALYLNDNIKYLSQVNLNFIKEIVSILSITTKISQDLDYNLASNDKNGKIIELCKKSKANRFLLGPAAKTYIDEDRFLKEGIELIYMDYSVYPDYHQVYLPFEHKVSVIDLIFNEGPNAHKFMKFESKILP